MSENTTTLHLGSTADVVAAIPYLVGFHPSDSLVVLGLGASAGAWAVRVDLTAPDGVLRHVAGLVTRRDPAHVVLAGYGPGERVTPVLDRARGLLEDSGVMPRDVLRVDGGRFWSFLCDDPVCCPAEGTPIGTRAVAAEATFGGLVALPDRAELERTIEPIGGEALREARERAEGRLMTWSKWGTEATRERMIEVGVPLIGSLIQRAVAGAGPPSDDEVALAGVLLTCLRVRDEAWVRIDDERLPAHVGLWRHVLRRMPERYVAGPACLLAFAAWRQGDGALANLALDRAFAADPDYSMAGLLRQLIVSGIPPSSVPMTMTPDQLDEPG